MTLRLVPDSAPDPLVATFVRLPGGEIAYVESVDGDSTELTYVTGSKADTLTHRDTQTVRECPVIARWVGGLTP